MPLKLPAKNAEPTQENVRALQEGLTSIIAGHPGAAELWTFYEAIDEYLGPWGDGGYPIGYGKYYCKLFNDNSKLRNDDEGAAWILRTTINLQESLRDFIVNQFSKGKLANLTEPELRRYAFSTHAKVYNDSGLVKIIFLAPELLPVIVSIPGKEYVPTAPYFTDTIEQIFETMRCVVPTTFAVGIAAMMPVHSGMLRRAAQQDIAEQLRSFQVSSRLLKKSL
jgi:hypothetical protein